MNVEPKSIKVVTITPKRASQLLEATAKLIADEKFAQRGLSLASVAALAQDIRNGNFLLTHQGIAVREDDAILDGRHRLAAIQAAGVPVRIYLAIYPTWHKNGNLVGPMDVVDRGRVRGIAQQLALHGEKNSALKAAVAKALSEVCSGDKTIKITTAQTYAVLDIYRKEIEAVISFGAPPYLNSYLVTPLAMWRVFEPAKADEFADSFFSMNLKKGEPAWALRRWLDGSGGATQSQRGGGYRLPAIRISASAMMHASQGNSIQKLYLNRGAVDWLLTNQKGHVRRVIAICGTGPAKANTEAQ